MRAASLLALASVPLSGCVAAAIPAVAAAGMVKGRDDTGADASPGKKHKKHPKTKKGSVATPKPGDSYDTPDGRVQITNLTELPAPGSSVAAPARAGGPAVPSGMQFLYGSGESAGLALQAYQGLYTYLHNEIGFRRDKTQIRSVVLSRGSTLDQPKFDLCGSRPLAIVLDVDETVLLNLGYESDVARRGDSGYDAARWDRWEKTGATKVAAVPGAAQALAAIRREGLTVIFNTNRVRSNAAQTSAALEGAGLGPAVLGDTLWLRDDGAPGGKDERRWKISEKYCVVAMVGDQLGDFSDLFNAPGLGVAARRAAAGDSMLAPLWGAGWFLLPNPVYGTGLKGGVDEVFPAAKQWADPAGEK